MPDASREAILNRLRAARSAPVKPPEASFDVLARRTWPAAERYPRLRRKMEAVRAELIETTPQDWPRAILDFARGESFATILYGPGTPEGERLASAPKEVSSPRLVPYDRPIESMKREVFEEIDAGFTTTRGGIADTGGLILCPSPAEPRLLSLVPPVHMALLDTDRIHDTFWRALKAEGWARGLPANALLVSGPSKTADIEQTLAYGVHGPKRLVVFAIRRFL